MQEPLNVVICGGGRTGHLNAVLFKQQVGVRVSLLTTCQDVIAAQRNEAATLTAMLPEGRTLSACLDAVGDEPGPIFRDADVVIITVPAHVRPQLLERIAGSLPRNKPVYVGAIPGFCGFDWLAEKALACHPNAVIWGMKDVPHTAFDLVPGVSVRMGGAKSALYVATSAKATKPQQTTLLAHLQRLYAAPVSLLDHYLEITLTPGNPIMHPAVIYGLIGPYGQWHNKAFPHRLCWWTDCTELGAYFLERSDEESQRLCKQIEDRLGIDLSSVKPLRQEIIDAYQEQIRDPGTLLSVLRTNHAYDAIEAPMIVSPDGNGYRVDQESRAFHEDVAFGLALLIGIAHRLSLSLPYIEEIFHWNVAYMGGLRQSALDYVPANWPA